MEENGGIVLNLWGHPEKLTSSAGKFLDVMHANIVQCKKIFRQNNNILQYKYQSSQL